MKVIVTCFLLFTLILNLHAQQIAKEAWVSHYASGMASGDDKVHDLAIDNNGNVYVTGSSTKIPAGTEYCTIKYDPDGNQLWEMRYGLGIENNSQKIKVDSMGNVYVTGFSMNLASDFDYATVKYNFEGEEQWVARYNGPANSYDGANSLTVDDQGNVFVTGYSTNSEADDDYTTIKYNSDGTEQWIARYDGPANGYDRANSLAIDNQGNVYVTGGSVGSETGSDYATIKYNSGGEEQWTARYNGPANSYDGANSLTVDDQGNVFVTGYSTNSEEDDDYTTIKYNSDGTEQWIARYDGPANGFDRANSLAVDKQGNVYVTGGSDGSGTAWDYATVKYNAAGQEKWVARYNGPDGGPAYASSVAVDIKGNVYVSGRRFAGMAFMSIFYDFTTVKYDSNGVQQWVAYDSDPESHDSFANSIAVDSQGNVYVTGSLTSDNRTYDYVTVKYDSACAELWVARYNSLGNNYNDPSSLAVDALGNVYVTGFNSISGYAYDYATVKYNSDGAEQWVAIYDSPDNGDDLATSLALDDEGNVYITGRSYRSGPGEQADYATIKYNSGGEEQWVAYYNGPGNEDDLASSMAVDIQGNVYVTGSSYGSGTSRDYATVKYNAAGEEQWVARYNGTGNGADWATSVAVDNQGNVYVTGYSTGSGNDYDYVTIKYDSTGTEKWVARYNGPGNGNDQASSLALDSQDNVYVTGYSTGSGSAYDYTTLKYNSAGAEQWVAHYNGPGNDDDYSNSLALDNQGNVYVTGSSYGSRTSRDYATVKYNAAGIEQWVARFNGLGNNADAAKSLVVDEQANVYVTGYSTSSGDDNDYATLKYNPDGVEQWVVRYNNPDNTNNYASSLSLDNQGNVYVTGKSRNSEWNDYAFYTTIKYVQTATGLIEEISGSPKEYSLNQNYPNPFNPKTVISYQLPVPSSVELNIYNILGQKVVTLVSAKQPSGSYQVEWDASGFASGIYIYQLTAPGPKQNAVITKKLVLLN